MESDLLARSERFYDSLTDADLDARLERLDPVFAARLRELEAVDIEAALAFLKQSIDGAGRCRA